MPDTHIQLFNGNLPTKNHIVVPGVPMDDEEWLVYLPIVECGPVTHAVIYKSDNLDDIYSVELHAGAHVCVYNPCCVLIYWGDEEDPRGRARPKPVRPLLPENV